MLEASLGYEHLSAISGSTLARKLYMYAREDSMSRSSGLIMLVTPSSNCRASSTVGPLTTCGGFGDVEAIRMVHGRKDR